MSLARVIKPGQRTLIVGPADEARCAYGLPPGGPFDLEAAASANRAVGNAPDAPVLECAIVAPELQFDEDSLLAWCDGEGRVRQFGARGGESVALGRIRGGMRGTLAVRGGFVNPATEFELQPRLVAAGDWLPIADPEGSTPRIAPLRREGRNVIRALAGPHQALPALLAFVQSARWRVTPQLDRVAVRMQAGVEAPATPGTLPSCGMQFGTVQWHPGGELVAMGPDHPVTGGYLQVMTILSSERWKLAHLQPGEEVRWMLER